MTAIEPTPRTTLRRHKERAEYDRSAIYEILDEGFICHAAVAVDETVSMIPTAYGRDGNGLLLHGAAANRVLKLAASGAELTISVTLVDGLVLARSTKKHSINFRSVVIFGRATEIRDPEAKARALEVIVNHMLPGRTVDARPASDAELAQTRVLSIPLDEVSAKVRTGGPVDDPDDLGLDVWAGVLPLKQTAGPPKPESAVRAAAPSYLSQPRWNDK